MFFLLFAQIKQSTLNFFTSKTRNFLLLSLFINAIYVIKTQPFVFFMFYSFLNFFIT